MEFEHSAVVDRPVEEVFAWHAREGAVTRLLPPWYPVRVVRSPGSLSDGSGVLRLAGRLQLTWAREPAGFLDGRLFTDVARGWRHSHWFDPEPGGRTRLTDRVETRIPARLLGPAFAYRDRQLAGDLASQRRLVSRSLTVAVTGSAGLIGSALCAFLSTAGHRVVRLVRGDGKSSRGWHPEHPAADLLDGVDAVVHLAGASIAGRFTPAHKDLVRSSRVRPTRRLAEVAARAGVPVFVCASAIGIYGADRGDEELSEDSDRGGGFLADLVAEWEAACDPAREAGARVVNLRTGIVQSPGGGTLKLLRPLFQAGLGGRLGDGHQWMSWIGIDDVVDAYLRAVVDPALAGPVNAVAPDPVRNADYTRVLASVLRRPAALPVPRSGPALLLGTEGAREMAEASQRVVPARLRAAGHVFRFAGLEAALRHVLGRVDPG